MPSQNDAPKRSPAEASKELYGTYFDSSTPAALQRGMLAWSKLPPDVQTFVCAHLSYLAALQGGKVQRRLEKMDAKLENQAAMLEGLTEAFEDAAGEGGGEDEDDDEGGEGGDDAAEPAKPAAQAPRGLALPFLQALGEGFGQMNDDDDHDDAGPGGAGGDSGGDPGVEAP